MPKELVSNEGQGVLFQRTKVSGNQPQYEGNCCINGIQIRVVGWERTSKNGNPFISLKISKVGDQSWRNKAGNGARAEHTGTKDDSDIPW